jgi:hypothetical protein
MITKEDIQQLKKIYLEEFNETISDDCITENAQVLLDLLTVVYKKNKEGKNEKL